MFREGEAVQDIKFGGEVGREKTLIIGAGEIGKSLKTVLDQHYDVFIRDIKPDLAVDLQSYNVINICYPYFNGFEEATEKYIDQYKPELVIIHSTVPVGTTRKFGKVAVHSPVNGKHPNLTKSILTFVKFIGGQDVFSVFKAVHFLSQAGIQPFVFSSSEATELAKILCTTQYGWMVMIMKEIARICNDHNVPFHEVYTEWNNAYNQGYRTMGDAKFLRPILYPMDGGIGGHCVIPNLDLLDDWFTNTLKGRNEKSYKKNDSGNSQSRSKHNNLSSRAK